MHFLDEITFITTIFANFYFRILKILGCKLGCHDASRPQTMHLIGGHLTTASIETLRSRGEALLSRLLWYDKKQFKQFVAMLVESRDITFLVRFMHGYLSFCGDPYNPFSTSSTANSGNGPPTTSGGHPSES